MRLCGSTYNGTSPIPDSTLMTASPPNGPISSTFIVGIRFQCMYFEDTNIQSQQVVRDGSALGRPVQNNKKFIFSQFSWTHDQRCGQFDFSLDLLIF